MLKLPKRSLPWVRTIETNKARPKAPSQAAKVKKNKVKNISCPTPDKVKTISQKTLNIIYSKLSRVFSKCLRLEQNTHKPQAILKIGTE